ncbi:MAG: hypothetical protein ACTHLR_09210 [Rhizomicrobium sp.]
MPAYEIHYRHDDGTLSAKIETNCASDKEAKIFAHAMKMDGVRHLEVWKGETLIYERPQAYAIPARQPAELRL